MAFVREAILRLVIGGTISDLQALQQRVDENSRAIERWTEQPKDFWPMKNQDAFPSSTNDLESAYGSVLIVVNGKLYVRSGTSYVLVGSQT